MCVFSRTFPYDIVVGVWDIFMEDCVPGGAGVDETERESVEWDE